ncbi:MAG TPA: ATP-binding cassette domain-containing protein [Candidatus Azoamicus sp. MARI]
MLKINGFFKLKFDVFQSVFTFSLLTDKIVCIVGESGSGKSTFLKCISGLIIPSNGYLNINDNIFYDSKKCLFVKPNLRKIGYVFQNPYLYPYMNVFENITFALREENFGFNVQSLISFLNLNKIKKKSIDNLSGGEKQRICIAQVLFSGAKLVLLDEVLSNQDYNMKIKLISLFKLLNDKRVMSFIYVSHDIKSLDRVSNFIIYIHKGKICFMTD